MLLSQIRGVSFLKINKKAVFLEHNVCENPLCCYLFGINKYYLVFSEIKTVYFNKYYPIICKYDCHDEY